MEISIRTGELRNSLIDAILVLLLSFVAYEASVVNSIIYTIALVFLMLLTVLREDMLFVGVCFATAAYSDFLIISYSGRYITLNRVSSIIVIILLILRLRKLVVPKRLFYPCIILLLYGLASFFMEGLSGGFSWILNLIMFTLIISVNFENTELRTLIHSTILASLMMGVMTFISLIQNPYYSNEYSSRTSISNIYYGINANQLALGIVFIGAVVLFATIYFESNKFLRVICALVYFLDLYAVVETGSRNGLIGFLVVSLIIIISKIRSLGLSKETFLLILFIICLSVIIASFALRYFVNYLPADLLERYTIESVSENGATFRISSYPVWFLEIMPDKISHIIFGIGLGAETSHLIEYGYSTSTYAAPHNIILSSFLELGIVGFGAFLAILIPSLKACFKLLRENSTLSFFSVCFLACICCGLGETVFGERTFWISMAFLLSFYYNYSSLNDSTEVMEYREETN